MPDDPHYSVPYYVVLESNIVIARDVAEALKEQAPGAIVVAADSIGAALDQVGTLPRVTAAFIAAPAQRLLASGLGAAIEARGGRIVLCGTDALEDGVAAPGWRRLPRPFTSAMVQAAARENGVARAHCMCA